MIEILNNRIGELDKKDGIDCKLCKNKGVIYYLKEENKGTIYEDEAYVRDCECKKQRQALENIKNNGLLNVFDTKTLESYKTPYNWQLSIKNKALEYISSDKNEWLLLSGITGSGKTHIATAISIELVKKGLSYYYLQFSYELPLLAKDLENFDEVLRSKAERKLDKILNVDLLYVDDFLKINERQKQSIYSTLFTIINQRYINNKRTIFTTEYNLREINAYDSAIFGRIKEMCKGYIIDRTDDPSRNLRLGDKL